MLSGGTQFVEAGGKASNTIVDSGGWQYVLPGGTASATTIDGGTLILFNTGVFNGAIEFGAPDGQLALGGTSLASAISGFAPGDTIDLSLFGFTSGARALASGSTVTVSASGGTTLCTSRLR